MSEDSEHSKQESLDLNLGLSDLLSLDPISSLGLDVTQKAAEEKDSEPIPSNASHPSENPPPNSFQVLFDEGLLDELVSRCERKLAQKENGDRDDIETRLWWVKAQVEKGEVPLSILYAPLDSALTSLLDGAILQTETPTKVLAVSVLQRFFESASDGWVKSAALEKIALLGKSHPLSPQEEFPPGNLHPSLGVELRSHLSLTKPSFRDGKSRFLFGRKSMLSALLMIGLISFGITVSNPYLTRGGELAARMGLPLQELKSTEPVLIIPSLEKVSLRSELDGLAYDIEVKSPPERSTVSRSIVPITQKEGGSPAEKGVLPPSSLNNKHETINTSGPFEPEEIRRREVKPLKPMPSSPDKEEVYRDPFSAETVYQGNGNISANSKKSPAYEDRFVQGREYRILRATTVQVDPSFRSEKISSLFRGDHVEAEAIIRGWLQIRSRKGREGYVPLEDVEPLGH